MSKQDRQGVRTATQLEQKYQFGKSFAEVMGVAKDAQKAAEENTQNLDEKLTSEEIFNRLTNNGTLQGLYRGDDGDIYINAEFISSLEKLFAKDIKMSGKFTHTASIFLEPEKEEVETIKNHIAGTAPILTSRIKLYDFNNDGAITVSDMAKANLASIGLGSLASWSGAVKSNVTLTIDLSNPEKFLRITGTNMWGRTVDKYVGVNFTNIKNPDTENKLNEISKDYIVESGLLATGIWGVKLANGLCYLFGTITRNFDFSGITGVSRSELCSIYLPFPVYNQSVSVDCDDINAWASVGPNDNASIIQYVLWRSFAYGDLPYTIHFSVNGTWK